MGMSTVDKDLRWFDVKCVPKEYIMGEERRPQNLDPNISVCDPNIPVIDLLKSNAAEEILMASQEFGIFLVMNHGIPEKIVNDAMSVLKEFFELPSNDTSGVIPTRKGWVYTSNGVDPKSIDRVRLWRENLKHPCYPLEKCSHLWPDKPTTYQEVMARYLAEIEKLSGRILEMICEGLGLKQDYFKEKSQVQFLTCNFFPPCPDPTLTLGMPPHEDPSLLNILCQTGSSVGLQILKDDQWINVGTIPNAFVVNVGIYLESISNGKLKSVKHRVVTSKHESRLSVVTIVTPTLDYIIEPAKEMVNELEPSRYTPIRCKEFIVRNQTYGDNTMAIMEILQAEN